EDVSERPIPFPLNVRSVSHIQDRQGSVLYFTYVRSNDGKDFVLVCNTSWPTCPPGLKIGDDFTFTVLQPGDSNYVNGYAAFTGAVGNGVVVICKGVVNGATSDYVFALVKQKDFNSTSFE